MKFDNKLITLVLAIILLIAVTPASFAVSSNNEKIWTTVSLEAYGTVPIPDPEVPPSPGEENTSAAERTLPTAIQYVPYKEVITSVQTLVQSHFELAGGKLPDGLSMDDSGVITGFPLELGVFNFTVLEYNSSGAGLRDFTLSVYSRMYADVEAVNVPDYGFVITGDDNGHVKDQIVTAVEELKDQIMHCEGPYPQFRNLYLDARQLVRGVEYLAEEGSTKITLLSETIGEEGGGTHTLAAEFETEDGETVYTVQNYVVAGIASTEVRVTVNGQPVIWTDSEPYIDTNNRTMTPFRIIGEALGLTINWSSSTREASFSDGEQTIWFPIGGLTARTSKGADVEMDTSAVIVNGRTYAPIRYLAEFFGYSISWDRSTRTVMIS